MTRLFSTLVLAVILGGLIGCAALTEPFGVKDPFAIPKPFEGRERNDTMLQQATEVPAVVVNAPMGLDDAIAMALRDRVVTVAQARDVPAMAVSVVRAWTLDGRAARISTSNKGGGESVVIFWRLVDDQAVERARFSAEAKSGADGLSEVALADLATQTATRLDTALMRPDTQIAQQTTSIEKAIVWVGVIRGAPGDGNQSLTRALGGVLPLKGVQVEKNKAKAQWRIEGQVEVANASATQDVVKLTWHVFDAKGVEAGKIEQENAVPHGRLSKPWAEIAGFAAEAAAEGITQLIQQLSAAKPV